MARRYDKIDRRKNKKKELERREKNLAEKSKLLEVPSTWSYTKLCDFLEEPVKGSNSKDSQLKLWSRYFNFEKIDRKLVIQKIYPEPLPKEIIYPANMIYTEDITQIILFYLQEEKQLILNTDEICLLLGLINEEYINKKRQKTYLVKELKSIFTDLDLLYMSIHGTSKTLMSYITAFYYGYRGKFTEIFITAFDSMQRNKLIKYRKIYRLEYKDSYHYTNLEETKKILNIQKKVLQDLNCKSDGDVYLYRKQEEYHKLMLENIQMIYPDVIKVYQYYQITALPDMHKYCQTFSNFNERRVQERRKNVNNNIIKYIYEKEEAQFEKYKYLENNISNKILDGSVSDNKEFLEYKNAKNNLSAQKYLCEKLLRI